MLMKIHNKIKFISKCKSNMKNIQIFVNQIYKIKTFLFLETFIFLCVIL